MSAIDGSYIEPRVSAQTLRNMQAEMQTENG